MTSQPRLDFDPADPLDARDAAARAFAVDPTRNVALEASAGTGKTRVLVDRYVGLLLAGVDARNILAITFTRKAAAEMRQRIFDDLSRRRREGRLSPALWEELRASAPDIAVSTIDAFCLALLREFPLEAGVDPGFELADETETPRLIAEALDRTLRIGRGLAVDSPELALLVAELGDSRLREGLARLIDRRLVADPALTRFLSRHPGPATIESAVTQLTARLRTAFASVPGGLGGFVASGPRHPDFDLLTADIRQLLDEPPPPAPIVQALLERVDDHLFTQGGEPRKRLIYRRDQFRSAADHARHAAMVAALGPYVVDALASYRREINVVFARAARRLLTMALDEYGAILRKHGVLDFAAVLERTLLLLSRMDEFSRSRYKLESRYQHVLVDEFQDTSRAQWALVELLVRSWAEGLGLVDSDRRPTVFIVGDRKQSIYGFRDAEVAVLDEAARFIAALRPGTQVRTAITRSFRSARELLAFVNDVFAEVAKVPDRADAFRYEEDDRFPVASVDASEPEPLGAIVTASETAQAEVVADEIVRLLVGGATVRDRDTGVRRPVRPGDIGILFRTRDGHRLLENALARRQVPFYVYKGLGFFDADEVKDVVALLAFLANPASELRAAAFLRSRFVRLTDAALKLLAPALATALLDRCPPPALQRLGEYDRTMLELARHSVPRWLTLVDTLPPAELLDRVLAESAYPAETRGAAYRQARENLKKVRSLVRRLQNRGYATLARIVDYFSQLAAGGDESNAIIDAVDAVNLMTVHAAKGLEFPIVFVLNLGRGSGGAGEPIRLLVSGSPESGEVSVAIGEYESQADRDLEAKESEEAKRLLYVAMTRARDRLYLGATLARDGRFVPARGSLGRALPASVCDLLTRAGASEGDPVVWWSGTAARHAIRVVKAGAGEEAYRARTTELIDRIDAFAPLTAPDAPARVTATAPTAPGAAESANRAAPTGGELAAASEWAGTIWYEVPFSLRRRDGAIVRGVIDAMVELPDGGVEVLEFRRGSRGEADVQQLALYVEAARALFPDRHVGGRVLSAEGQLSGQRGV